jgi:pSer/pThr/pTyr-binding forkhead associated (FHA) protein
MLTDEDVSREHAAFERRWQGVYVRDLGSKNGLEIAGRRLRTERRVHDGEVVVVGGTQLRVDDPEERYLRQMEEAKEPSRKAALAASSQAAGQAGNPAASGHPGSHPGSSAPGVASVAVPTAAGAAASAGLATQFGRGVPSEPSRSSLSQVKPLAAAAASMGTTHKKIEPVPFESALDARAVSLTETEEAAQPPRERSSRVLPLFVTVFSLAVLGGVGYLVWVLFGMTGERP